MTLPGDALRKVVSVIVTVVMIGTRGGTASLPSPSSYYYDHWCGGELQYLDDSQCAKIFPFTVDREWICPITAFKIEIGDGYLPDAPLPSVPIDTESLESVVTDPEDIDLCIILTKRELSSSKTKLLNKYFCLGNSSVREPYETWSSSKIYAVANAAGRMRINESHCDDNWPFGLDAYVTGKDGVTSLGDLITIICSYDETVGYSSNSLSSYFHDIGWRERLDETILHDWLGAATNQSLGGNYGESTPADLSFTVESSFDVYNTTCAVDEDPWPIIYSNSISALTAAEMTRRLVLHRELDSQYRYPGLQWKDVQQILYGAGNNSIFFPSQSWGGMTADTAIFLQTAMEKASADSHGGRNLSDSWRIFSKLGAGYSTSRGRGEIVTTAYGCFPASEGTDGVELTVTCRGSVVGDVTLKTVEARVKLAVDQAVAYAISVA